MKRYLIATIAIAAAVMGCDETVYKLEMAPKGNQLSRTLTVWRQGGSGDGERGVKPLGDAELAEIAKVYSQDKPKGDVNKPKFTGTFTNVLPNDVGGSGRFVRRESRMGVASSYIERFRGNDRPGEVIAASLKAVDKVTNILIGYMETELGKEPEFPKLRKFMDTEFRKDLKNLSAYSYLASSTSRLNWLDVKKVEKNTSVHEIIARVAAYIIERGYIKPSDLPLLKRSFIDEAQAGKLLDTVLTRIAAKAGITDAKFTARLASLLTNEEKLDTSFEAYLRKTPQYKRIIKARKSADGDDTSAAKLVINPLLKKAVHLRLDLGLGNTQRVEVELALPVKPAYTNGEWNAKDRTVTWKGSLTKRGDKTTFLPEICYALWSKPDEKFQKAHFGKVILTGEQLLNYCLWRQSLDANEAKLWDAVLMKHKPGEDIEAAVTAAADTDKLMPYIKEGLRILQQALKK